MPADADWYSVYFETRAPAGTAAAAAENAADALLDLLMDNSGTVSASRSSWSARVSVLAFDAREAAETGVALIQRMAVKAGMPSWPSVRAEATRQDVLDEDNARPTLPELVSAPEAAEILGVSPQRVHELASNPGFPEPMYELRTGRLWLGSAISAYADRRQRKPGRPRKNAAASRILASQARDALPSSRPSSASMALVKLGRASAIARPAAE